MVLSTLRCAPALRMRLAMLLAAAAALQQAAAVRVANADEFVAAIRSNDEFIEVTEHLYLNDGEAVSLADAIENEGYLFNIVGTQRTITGNCASMPPRDMADGLPANLVSSNGWPYAKLPPLKPNQCVLRIASGFAQVSDAGSLHLDNLVISAPYLFGRDEAVGPTAADTPPATPPRGDDYTEDFDPAAPGPYAIDYEDLAEYSSGPAAGPSSYYSDYGTFPGAAPYSYYGDYGAPGPSPYAEYDLGPALGPDISDYAAPPRPYEGRAEYPDYEDSDAPASYSFARDRVILGALVTMLPASPFLPIQDYTEPAAAPAPVSEPPPPESIIPQVPDAPLPQQLFMTNVTLAGGNAHVGSEESSLYAEGCSFIDGEGDSITLRESTASLVSCVISSNGDTPGFGGVYMLAAALMRAEAVTFVNNGDQNDYTPEDDRYGVWLLGPKTRMYTDDPVNVEDTSRGDVLPLADAPAGAFLTRP